MFNINEFKGAMNKYGGPARKNLFVVEIVKTPNGNDGMSTSDLRFFCQSATTPGINFAVQDYMPNGFGLRQTVPIAVNLDQFNAVFMLDSDHMVLRFFHQWMQTIINYNYSDGAFSEVGEKLPFEIGYKEDFAATIIIKQYSTDSEDSYYEYTLHEAFPTQISGVDSAWSDNDSFATATVNFAYSHITMTGTKRGSPTDRNARGTGLLDLINRTGNTGQVINQLSLPRSIQDAVNSFTQINTGINGLKNGFSQIKSGLNNIF